MSNLHPIGQVYKFKESDFLNKELTKNMSTEKLYICFDEDITYERINRGCGGDKKTTSSFYAIDLKGNMDTSMRFDLLTNWWSNDIRLKDVEVIDSYNVKPILTYEISKK